MSQMCLFSGTGRLVTSVIGQLGDLSYVPHQAGVRASRITATSCLAHGGMLDRFDCTFVALLYRCRCDLYCFVCTWFQL